MTLKIGQELWYVPLQRYSGNQRTVRVTKVGRKWAELEPSYIGRVHIETLYIDGRQYTSPGRCWLSKEEYEAELRRKQVWDDFHQRIRNSYSPPDGVTIETIEAVKKLLGYS